MAYDASVVHYRTFIINSIKSNFTSDVEAVNAWATIVAHAFSYLTTPTVTVTGIAAAKAAAALTLGPKVTPMSVAAAYAAAGLAVCLPGNSSSAIITPPIGVPDINALVGIAPSNTITLSVTTVVACVGTWLKTGTTTVPPAGPIPWV